TQIVVEPGFPVPHFGVHIWDPSVPGNSVYTDLGPATDVTFANMAANVPAYVDILPTVPSGMYPVPGTHTSRAAAPTAAAIIQGITAQQSAADGLLQYNFLNFGWNPQSTSGATNCAGYASGF